MNQIQIGQKISTNLYNKGVGYVYRIHGEQKPNTVKALFGGIGAMGGNAEFDIVFVSGALTSRLSECILHGVQWKIHGEVVGQDVLDELLAKAEKLEIEAKEEKAKAEAAFAQEVKALSVNPDLAYLSQDFTGKKSNHAVVAGNVRLMLKKHFPGVRFSVKSSCSRIDVSWTDGPTDKAVDALLHCFEEGAFDANEDMYKFNVSPWNRVFGGIEYLFTYRKFSDELIQKGIDSLCGQYPCNITVRPTVAAYKDGALRLVHCGLPFDLEKEIRLEICKLAV